MTTSGERSPAEVREAELAKVFRRMGKAARRGDSERYEELRAIHDRLKADHVRLSHEEQRAEARARVAERRALEGRERSRRPWRLPRGFSSPLAAQRAREARPEWVVPVGRPVLRPWAGVHPLSERIWWPGR